MKANEEMQKLEADMARTIGAARHLEQKRYHDVVARSEAAAAAARVDDAKYAAMFPETDKEREILAQLAVIETLYAPTDEIDGNLGPYRGRLRADLLALRELRELQARRAKHTAHLAAQPSRARFRPGLVDQSDAMIVALEMWNGVMIDGTIWSVDYDNGGPIGYVPASQVEAVRAALASHPVANTRLLLLEGDARWRPDAIAIAAGVHADNWTYWASKLGCARTAFRWALAANGGNWTLTTGDQDTRSLSAGETHGSSARSRHLMSVAAKTGGLADAAHFWGALSDDTRGAA